ncbi:hypothetical protein BKA62DRAFT_82137 [Auriculariales sp. MPI-PUGE-AT-0066]|nr:hypothetical protein BKA62DRAFT_82137 [Auriculariales sp. MPI-PUGE-AT-0066]
MVALRLSGSTLHDTPVQTILLLVSSAWAWFGNVPEPAPPTSCLAKSGTFEQLVQCLNSYTVPAKTYDADTYAEAQPTDPQLAAWTSAVQTLMTVGTSNTCTAAIATIDENNALYGIYTFADFTDSENNAAYCVLIESTGTEADKYSKGWGFLAVPTFAVPSRLHLSAPHPIFDEDTPEQAGALFKSAGARSLLIAGRHRQSYHVPTSCIQPLNNRTIYFKTDPAHDIEQPFFAASIALFEAQTAAPGGCPAASCAFLQLHAKATTTCAKDKAFLSAGLGHTPLDVAWYTDATYRPVKGLKSALLAPDAFPDWTIALPSDDTSCILVASTNVFGRFLNGVAPSDVCTTPAKVAQTSGRFIHAEQAVASRGPGGYRGWTNALKATFDLI